MKRGTLLILVIAMLIVAGLTIYIIEGGQQSMQTAEETVASLGSQATPLDIALTNLKSATEAYEADDNSENCTELMNRIEVAKLEIEASTLSGIKKWALKEFLENLRRQLPENCGE